MKPYSLDLRKKIVESVKKGVPKAETARRFGVDRATVKRYSASNSTSAAPSWRGRLPARETEARREGHEAAR
jgi:transposase